MQIEQLGFNGWILLALLSAGQGVFLSILLFSKSKKEAPASIWIAFLTLVFSLILIDSLGYWTSAHLIFPHFASSYTWLTFLIAPLFYHYFRVVFKEKIGGISLALHFLPAILYFGLKLRFVLASASVKIQVLKGELPFPAFHNIPYPYFHIGTHLLVSSQLLIYCYLSYRLMQEQALKKGTIPLLFYKYLLGLFLIFVGAYAFYAIASFMSWYQIVLDYSVTLGMAFSIYAIAFLAYFQPQIFQQQSFKVLTTIPPKYKSSNLTKAAAQSIQRKLIEYMDNEEPYLDSNLRLPQLAELLHTQPHHLSQVINEYCNQSFSSFINDYRIERAKQLLQSKQDLKVTDIAYQVGFNNKTSFYLAFKAKMEVSPSAYRKSGAG